jgi:leucyl/phenylalanyl-tRNA--protein transferase
MPVFRLTRRLAFPRPDLADESGLLAVGGDLRPERLLLAYASGIFPWPHAGLPLLWFSPDPRMVLPTGELRVSRRLGRTIRAGAHRVRLDTACRAVIEGCATTPRRGEPGTWITSEMVEAYVRLHELGFVHSAECWVGERLVGGLYGVSLGAVFVGESMFSRERDASKIALVGLVRQLARWGIGLVDVQVHTDHLASLGAREWPRERYLAELAGALDAPTRRGAWRLDDDLP